MDNFRKVGDLNRKLFAMLCPGVSVGLAPDCEDLQFIVEKPVGNSGCTIAYCGIHDVPLKFSQPDASQVRISYCPECEENPRDSRPFP